MRVICSLLLDQWNAVADALFAFFNEDGGVFVCYQHILLFVHCDSVHSLVMLEMFGMFLILRPAWIVVEKGVA